MLRFIFLIAGFLMLIGSGSALAITDQDTYSFSPKANVSKPAKATADQPAPPVNVQYFSLDGSGYLTVVLHGNKVIDAHHLKQDNTSLEIQKISKTQSKTRSFPSAQVSLENEGIIIVQLTFADETVVFVIIHIASGNTTIVQQ